MTQLTLQALLPREGRDPDLTLVLEWPPSLNHSYINVAIPPKLSDIAMALKEHELSGKFYNWLRRHTRTRRQPSDKAKTYRDVAAWQIKAKVRSFRFGDARMAAWLNFHPPRNGDWDLDNYKKHLLDAIEQSGVIDNDKQFDAILVTRGDKVEGGSVEVLLWRIS